MGTATAKPNQFGLAICKALGLEGVSRLQIDIKEYGIAQVTATFPVIHEGVLVDVVKHFNLSAYPVDVVR